MSFFEDLAGNAALAGERALSQYNANEYAMERDANQSKLDVERTKTIEQTRLAMQEQQRQAQMKRQSDQLAQAEAGGQQIAKDRRTKEIADMRAGDVPVDSYAELTPEQTKALEQGGRLTAPTPVSTIDDQLAAARKGGLYDAEAALKSTRAETVKAMQDEWKRKVDERKLDQGDAKNELLAQRNDALLQRLATGAGGGVTDLDKEVAILRRVGRSESEIADFITEKKKPSLEDLATGFMKADIMAGTPQAMTPAAAVARAKELRALLSTADKPAAPAPAAPAPQAKPTAPAAQALPMPKSAKEAIPGKVYNTSRGPARWNGTAFEPI